VSFHNIDRRNDANTALTSPVSFHMEGLQEADKSGVP